MIDPKGPASVIASRDELLAWERANWTEPNGLPQWAKKLQNDFKTHSVIEAIEERVSSILAEAKGFDLAQRPPVRLGKVASYLNARVFLSHRLKSGITRQETQHGLTPRSPTAAVSFDTNGNALISVEDRGKEANRREVAHELGHVLLFKDGDSLDLSSWRRATWSSFEEAVCTYSARLILLPDSLVLHGLGQAENLSGFVVQAVASPNRVTLPMAALRCLDLAKRGRPRLRAFVYWKQYHPLDRRFVHAAARQSSDEARSYLMTVAARLRDTREVPSFEAAIAGWSRALQVNTNDVNPTQGTFRAFTQAPFDETPASSERTPAGMRDAITRITNPSSHAYLRPEWVVWRDRPTGTFVPLRRGHCRAGSITSLAAASQTTDSLTASERVELGDLRGNFQVHAFASGDTRTGTRYVLAALEDAEL
jgi:Zn-dependent peptidase ImmA (M78 family)